MFGVYKPIAPTAASLSGSFRSIVDANNVQLLSGSIDSYSFTATDIGLLRKFSRHPALFDILAGSIAPSIRGLEPVKRALLLQMLGGKEQSLANGIHLRGDINILLVGDPSCGESQLLRFVLGRGPHGGGGEGSRDRGASAGGGSDGAGGRRRGVHRRVRQDERDRPRGDP